MEQHENEPIVLKTLEELKLDYIGHVLISCSYNNTEASRVLGISLKGLRNIIARNPHLSPAKKRGRKTVEQKAEETGYFEPTQQERDDWYNRNFY